MPDEEYNVKFVPSTIEEIDMSMMGHIDSKMNLHTTSNEGVVKVPVLWLGTERGHQVKNN